MKIPASVYLRLTVTSFGLTSSFAWADTHAPDDEQIFGPPHEAFDSVLWKQPGRGRLGMISGLVHSYKIIGMTRTRIHELLGAPAPIESADRLGSSDTTDTYALTHDRSGNAPVTYLNINYDDKDEVKNLCLRKTQQMLGVSNTFGKTITENLSPNKDNK